MAYSEEESTPVQGSTDTPASYSLNIPGNSQAEQYAQMQAMFNQIAAQRQGPFGRMLINTAAAQMLPQKEGAQILAMGRSGMALLNGTAPEFPFAAWAQQHQLPPSPNTQMMGKVLSDLEKTPQGDPRVQRGIDNFIYNDILNGALKEGEQKFGGMGNVSSILQGNYHTDAERDWDMGLHRKMTYGVNAANLSKDVKKNIDYIQDQIGKGEMPSEEYIKAVNEYHNTFLDPNIPIDQKIEQTEKLRDKMESYANLEQVGKVFVPEGWKWLTDSTIKKAVDEKGNPIPGAWAEWKIENPQGINMMPQFKDSVNKMNDYLNRIGNDLGIKNDDKRKEYIASYFLDKSPHAETQVLHNEKNLILKEETEGKTLPGGTQEINFGPTNQYKASVENYSINPTNVDLGQVDNIVTRENGGSKSVDLGTDAKIGNIIKAPVSIQDGKMVLVPDKDKVNAKHLFYAPMAVVQKPVIETQTVPINPANPSEGTKTIRVPSQTQYEEYYVPLNQVAGKLINSTTNKEERKSMENTIDQVIQESEEQNDANASKEANDYFRNNFLTKETKSTGKPVTTAKKATY